VRLSGPAAVLPEPRDYGPLPFTWYYGQTPRQVQDLVGADNRLVTIQVERASPLLLDVAMVRNSGTAHKDWWWVPGAGEAVGGSQLGEYCAFREGRVVSLAPYVVDGTTYFAAVLVANNGSTAYAAVMIPNTGPDEQKWWWYTGVDAASVKASLKENKALLASLQSADRAGTTFDVIMNAGVVNTMPSFQAVSWVWGTGDTD
jgi:hypothetical protein